MANNESSSSLDFSVPGQALDELLAVEPADITTVIDAGVEFLGTLNINNGRSVLVSGKIVGKIVSNGAVIVNVGAEVVGSIRAKSLQVGGRVARQTENDILDIEEAIVLARTAVMECDAIAKGMKTEYGAEICGRYQPRKPEATPLGTPMRSSLNPGYSSSTPSNSGPSADVVELHAAGAAR